ncbi:potassium voltage-gated channel protein Shaw-like [Gigantopelta aegis]|uniref:potassium voltage-gated channel protein Shaw-like n=1 Tax=Gigantopelta aegis TaxID=1735272 RepID=UPI001B88E621|nr:potassium voltage-gated channel protein Shaw-like [Gigantopelta aegis]
MFTGLPRPKVAFAKSQIWNQVFTPAEFGRPLKIAAEPVEIRQRPVYGITSFLFVISSIAGFCLETIPELRPKVVRNVTSSCDGKTTNNIAVIMASHEALSVLDIICTVFFTLELIARFTFAPNKMRFVKSIMNIIDLLALVPMYVQVIFEQSSLQACYLNERLVIEILFILRIIRMFRVFHLVKHYQALKVLVYSLKASLHELLMLLIFLMIGMLVFATMIYYTERKDAVNPSDTFNTIPVGFWWAIITMTTVGYGDKYPSTPVGYVVGTACAVCGVLLLALTFPVISNNFTLFYHHVRSRSSLLRNKNTIFNPDLPSNEKEDSEIIPQKESSDHVIEEGVKNSSSDLRNRKDANSRRDSKQSKEFETVVKFSETTSLTDAILVKDESDTIISTEIEHFRELQDGYESSDELPVLFSPSTHIITIKRICKPISFAKYLNTKPDSHPEQG